MADGKYTLDLEAALAKLPPAIEESERVITQAIPRVNELIRETCKEVGAQELIRAGEAAVVTVEGVNEMYKEMVGQEGDSVTTGSGYGALAYAKKQDRVLNGAD